MAVPLDRDRDFVDCTAERNMFEKIEQGVWIDIVGGELLQRGADLGQRLPTGDLVDCHGNSASIGRAGGQRFAEADHPVAINGIANRVWPAIVTVDPSRVVTCNRGGKCHLESPMATLLGGLGCPKDTGSTLRCVGDLVAYERVLARHFE